MNNERPKHRHHHSHRRKQSYFPPSHSSPLRILASERLVRPPNGWVHLTFSLPSTAVNISTPLMGSFEVSKPQKDLRDIVLEVTCQHCHLTTWRDKEKNSQHQPFLSLKTSVPRLEKVRFIYSFI